jgi:TRAP-type uncharacterized transport system substrate-binding protein
MGKEVPFAGAGQVYWGTPWGTLGVVAQRALAPLGYDLTFFVDMWGADNPRYVRDRKADLGAHAFTGVRNMYEGAGPYANEEACPGLRLIAQICEPAWLAIAVRAESGITDLREVAERKLPIRVKTGRAGEEMRIIWGHFGPSLAQIEEWGGTFLPMPGPGRAVTPWVASGEFDAIVDSIYAAYTPEHRHWWEATVLHDLRFLPVPEDLARKLVDAGFYEEVSFIPHMLMRGIREDIPSVQRLPNVFYTRDDVDEGFIYEVTKALDDGRHLFRQTHLPYSYDPKFVAKPRSVPLHPGAERYYREAGYLPA